MKIVFFGTPDFASSILRALSSDNYFSVVKVISAMDKPVGRKMILTMPDVIKTAKELSLDTYQTDNVKTDFNIDKIIDECDICVVASFGQIIPKRLLDKKRFINVHASLLPKYRGASPIQSAILHGDGETGISIMDMDENLDTGDVLSQEKIKIECDDTAESLFDKLADLGGNLLINTLKNLDSIKPVKQADMKDEVIITKKIKKEDALIVPSDMDAKEADLIIRGMYSWPIAYMIVDDKKLQIHKATIVNEDEIPNINKLIDEKKAKDFYLKFKTGILKLDLVKPEGKNIMSGKEYMAGHRD
jgi:methionyl-tRNA formyltransferase